MVGRYRVHPAAHRLATKAELALSISEIPERVLPLDRHEAEVVRPVIMGAGPAGLTAAWALTHSGIGVDVLEADPAEVGGIARTASYKGFRFDIGGHRFFTKAADVEELWHEILDKEDWLRVPRMSRIYYRGKFFNYPLKPLNALRGLGLIETVLCVVSYMWARVFPRKPEVSFEDWVRNRFGERLYRIFFKTYTEKVWGMPCHEISADWAGQRIKGLSLLGAIKDALLPKSGGEVVKTLIEEFEYPKFGPGMMWETAASKIAPLGGKVHMGHRVTAIRHEQGRVREVEATSSAGTRAVFEGTDFISTLPIRELVNMLSPAAPAEVRAAADALRYRDFLTIVLIVDRPDSFPDNWIYVHDPSVRLGRVQNFRNWSPHMVPDPSKTALGLEYFCNATEELWSMDNEDLIALGTKELAAIGLCDPREVIDGTVVRMPKAYPVYDDTYQQNVAVVREYLDRRLTNLQLAGRNGMHKYNNQDHSMMTALFAAKNILGANLDQWKVNTDAEYHEEAREDADTAGRMVPRTRAANV